MLKLKEIRISKNLSQNKLSKLSGVSQGYISELENDGYKCTVQIICQLCKALYVTPNELIDVSCWSNHSEQNE